jgi:hypothetical protein
MPESVELMLTETQERSLIILVVIAQQQSIDALQQWLKFGLTYEMLVGITTTSLEKVCIQVSNLKI